MSRSADTTNVNLANNEAVNNFCEYLRIPSVQPNINYSDCEDFLKKQAKSLGLPVRVYHYNPKKPIIVITWEGQQPELPSILLNSHMDVVPAFEDKWTHNPFAADIDAEGNIYGRGAQDMKCVGIQYLEAIRKLKNDGVLLKRTVHISFVPDEEIGGADGMRRFVNTEDFRELNVEFSLDEGVASAGDDYVLKYGERPVWQLHIHCPGATGHGSHLLENTAGEKVAYLMNKFYELRKVEQAKLKENSELTLGDVTSVNVTQLQGGLMANVIPPEFIMVVDCRLAVTVDLNEWEATINQWCREAGEGVWIEYEQKEPQIPVTKLDETNPFWIALKDTANQLGLALRKQISPGCTDGRFIRALGLPVLGFSPINNTPVLLHDNDECLNVNTFLRGIDIYTAFITGLANVEPTTA